MTSVVYLCSESLQSERAGSHLGGIGGVVKSKATRWVRETFPDQQNFAWQEGFGSLMVSQSNLDAVRSYLEEQREHHRVKTFKDEFR